MQIEETNQGRFNVEDSFQVRTGDAPTRAATHLRRCRDGWPQNSLPPRQCQSGGLRHSAFDFWLHLATGLRASRQTTPKSNAKRDVITRALTQYSVKSVGRNDATRLHTPDQTPNVPRQVASRATRSGWCAAARNARHTGILAGVTVSAESFWVSMLPRASRYHLLITNASFWLFGIVMRGG
jgi:hypothetical protein